MIKIKKIKCIPRNTRVKMQDTKNEEKITRTTIMKYYPYRNKNIESGFLLATAEELRGREGRR